MPRKAKSAAAPKPAIDYAALSKIINTLKISIGWWEVRNKWIANCIIDQIHHHAESASTWEDAALVLIDKLRKEGIVEYE
jgi:hypothetical protein